MIPNLYMGSSILTTHPVKTVLLVPGTNWNSKQYIYVNSATIIVIIIVKILFVMILAIIIKPIVLLL